MKENKELNMRSTTVTGKRIKILSVQFSSVQSFSRVQLFAISLIAACEDSLSITNSWSSPRLMSIESVMPSNHLIRLEKVSFPSNPKERQCQRMLKLPHNCSHLTHYKVMLKIPQARLQQYLNCELPDVQAGFRKGRGTRE